MTALLSIRDLKIRRGSQIALSLHSLDIHAGEVLAVVGPNGAGKSTLLLALARLLKPEQGEIDFKGQTIQSESDTTYRRRLALVMQDPLLLDMSVFDNVAAGLKFRGVKRSEIQPRVRIWLDRLGVAHLSKRRANRLSGGEAQRVSLARAFALEPELLLLDESFSSLDPPTRNRLITDLHALLAETKTTTVFITHDLHEAAILGHRVAVIMDGVLRQVGKPEEVFNNQFDPLIVQFTSQFKKLSREIFAG